LLLGIGVLFYVLLVLTNDFIIPPNARPARSYLAKKEPLVLSHRGSRYLLPENTIHAYKWALNLGANVLEFDVRLTKDNKMLVFHDDTLDRVTNGTGAFRGWNFDDIRKLEVGYWYTPYSDDTIEKQRYPFRGRGLKIPTLKEVLDSFPQVEKNIEIKDDDKLAVELLWEELKLRPEIRDQVVVSSRWCTAIDYFRQISNHVIATAACEGEVVVFLILTKLHLYKLWYFLSNPISETF